MASIYVSNLVINAGATFTQDFFLEDAASNSALDLSTATIESQMRKWAGSATSTTFTTSVVDASTGQLRLALPASSTSSLKSGRYVYDVLLTNNGETTRVVEGMVLVREGVTR